MASSSVPAHHKSFKYNLDSLHWNEDHTRNEEGVYCYCGLDISGDESVLQCESCNQLFHWDCVSCLKQKPLRGDSFYTFRCAVCEGGSELYQRMSISWVQVIYLVLYHMMTGEPDKKYFRWRENICAVIDEYWDYLLPGKERTATWQNTVAGCLSTNNVIFKSGIEDTGIPGNWALAEVVPPPKHGFTKPTRVKDPNKLPRQSRKSDSAPKSKRDKSLDSSNEGGESKKKSRKRAQLSEKDIIKSKSNGNGNNSNGNGNGKPSHDSESPPWKRAKTNVNLVDSELLQSFQHFTNLQKARQSNKPDDIAPQATEGTGDDDDDDNNNNNNNNNGSNVHTVSRTTSPSSTPRARRTQPSVSPKVYSKEKFQSYLSSESGSDDEERSDMGDLSDWSDDPEISAMIDPLLLGEEGGKKPKRDVAKLTSSDQNDNPSSSLSSLSQRGDFSESKRTCDRDSSDAEHQSTTSRASSGGKTLPGSRHFRGHTIDFSSSPSPSDSEESCHEHNDSGNADDNRGLHSLAATASNDGGSPLSSLPSFLSNQDAISPLAWSPWNSPPEHRNAHHHLDEGEAHIPPQNLPSPAPSPLLPPTPPRSSEKLLTFLSERKEWEVCTRLDHCEASKLPTAVRRLRRRLHLRRAKRLLGVSILNIDLRAHQLTVSPDHIDIAVAVDGANSAESQLLWLSEQDINAEFATATPEVINKTWQQQQQQQQQRQQQADAITTSSLAGLGSQANSDNVVLPTAIVKSLDHTPYHHSFASRLLGDSWGSAHFTNKAPMISPFHGRVLRPFIWRDYSCRTQPPVGLRLLREIRARSGGDLALDAGPSEAISYCYFQKQHLDQVNNLLGRTFWPGIDQSEALLCPEFSIVALYRRLVVGCAFITPDAYLTYIAVLPGWEGANIASFMLYHLSQSCPNKDMTLHVSAKNPAMILYQKFGFKPEQYIVDFYDKYLPQSSWMCKNAFFMRMRRR